MWLRRWSRRPVEQKSLEALANAEDSLQKVKKRGREVTRVANALRDVRERNHFAEQLEKMIVRPRGPLHHDT